MYFVQDKNNLNRFNFFYCLLNALFVVLFAKGFLFDNRGESLYSGGFDEPFLILRRVSAILHSLQSQEYCVFF